MDLEALAQAVEAWDHLGAFVSDLRIRSMLASSWA